MTYQIVIDDYIGRWCYSKQFVRNQLDKYKGKHVDVKISSFGGELDHGLDIRQQFVDHGDVTVYLSGFVASSATVIAMGAKRIVMSKYAMFLVHKCSNFIDAWGSYNADQMQQLIDELTANKKENDKIDVVLANMYADRCGKKVAEILDILKEGRWLNAQEALDYGFVDEIAEEPIEEKLDLTPELEMKLNALGYTTKGLKNCSLTRVTGLIKSIITNDPEYQEQSNPSTISQMKKDNKFSFKAVESLLDLGELSPDNDGDITITAEQMQKISNRLAELQNSISEKEDTATKNAEKINSLTTQVESLTAQVENLKKAPGDETTDIEDEAAEPDGSGFKANDMYNNLKHLI